MDKITIRIDEDIKAWLKEYAYQNRTTLSDVIRECVGQLKNQKEKE